MNIRKDSNNRQALRSLGQVVNGADSRAQITWRPIVDLNLDPRNPRINSPRQIRQIAKSIENFGFNVPVLVDRNLKVIAGNGRILAAKTRGTTELPTIMLDDLTEAQTRAFMIADNRLTENSLWDDRLLAEQLKELSLLDLDFELEATGFETAEIDLRIEEFDAEPVEPDPADALPELDSRHPVTRRGDLWILGRHYVYCASALEPAGYRQLFECSKAAMLFTYPRHNVRIAGNVSGLEKKKHGEFVMAPGEMTEAEFTAFLNSARSLMTLYSVEGSLHYLCMDWRHLRQLQAATLDVYAELKNPCLWVKDCRRDRVTLSEPARAGVRVPVRFRAPPEQRAARSVRAKSH
jgi:hypothetical protein